MNAPDSPRPGLAKTRGDRLVRRIAATWLLASDGRFRAMFDAADVVNEGSVRGAGRLAEWFGTTSLILAWPASIEDPSSRAFVAAVAERDPHVRLRAIRVARREASLRAPAPLGRVECEVRFGSNEAGLRIDVDVQAPLNLPSDVGASGRDP
jgi:hypothetical protein